MHELFYLVIYFIIFFYSIFSLFSQTGGYFKDPASGMNLRDSIVKLCGGLKDNAVSLVDCIAPPDFVLNSALGHSSGEVKILRALVDAYVHF